MVENITFNDFKRRICDIEVKDIKAKIISTLGSMLFFFLHVGASAQNGNFIVDYQTNITVEKGTRIQESSILIQINDTNSDWISDISILSSKNEKLQIIEASILDANNKVLRKLKNKEITRRSAISQGSFYEDNFVSEFKLKWHQYPYRVKYVYRKTSKDFVHLTRWYPALYQNVPVRQATLNVRMPLDYEVFLSFKESLNFRADTLDDHISLSWKGNYLKQVKQESFGINFREVLPSVTIVPKTFNYKIKGQFDSWASYGKWHSSVNEGLDELLPTEKAIVDRLIAGIDNRKEIAKKLYHYMQQNTRYINVTIEEGGLVPYPASYVCSNKYGDCKALTIYMKALLKYAGIDSFYSIIYAGSNPVRLDTDFPSQQFNHVILAVPIDKDTIWLENTANYLPFDYLGTFTQGRYALLVDGDKSRLVRTPCLKMHDVLEKNHYTMQLNSEGTGTVSVTKELRGAEFEQFKYLAGEVEENDFEERLRSYLSIRNIDQIKWKLNQPDPDEAMIILDLSMNIENTFRKLGTSKILSLFPIYSQPFRHNTPRANGIRINYPINKVDSIEILLPFVAQYQVKVPSRVAIESRFGSYAETYAMKEQKIVATRQFSLIAKDYPKEDYPEFYAFMQSIEESQSKSVIILNPF